MLDPNYTNTQRIPAEELLEIDGTGQAKGEATIGRNQDVVWKMRRRMVRMDWGFGEDARAVDRKDGAANIDAHKRDAQVPRIVDAGGGFGVEHPAFNL